MKKLNFIAALMALTFLSQAASAATIVSNILPESGMEISARELTLSDSEVFRDQMDKVSKMNETELRLELELQAAQIELIASKVESADSAVSEETRENLKMMAEGIRELAAKPDLKRRLDARKLLLIPGVLAQGLGYLGMFMGDLIGAPILFASKFAFNVGAGDNNGAGIALGMTGGLIAGGAVMIGEAILLGYNFPAYILTVLPIKLTLGMVCEDRDPVKERTRKFCRNYERNEELLNRIGDSAANAGQAINEFIRHPLKTISHRHRH
jgi:hypothetical protein